MTPIRRTLLLYPAISIFCVLTFSCQTSRVTTKTTEQKRDSLYDTANQYFKDGLLREASYSYKKVIQQSPKHWGAHRNLGIVYIKTGSYKKAIKHLKLSLKKYSSDFTSNFYLGEAYRGTEMYSEAIFRYRRALEKKRNDVKTIKALAWCYYKTRYYSQAYKVIKKLKNFSYKDPQVAIITARTLIKLRSLNKALTLIQKAEALAKKEDLPYLQSVEGEIYFAEKEYNKAQNVFRSALKEQPLLAGALLGLGKCLIETNSRLDLAIDYIERATRISPHLTEGFYLLGKMLEKTNPKKSYHYYNKFRKRASNDPEFTSKLPIINRKLKNLSSKR